MALGTSGAPHLRDRMVRIKGKSCSAAACASEDVSQNIPGPLQTYFKSGMRPLSNSNVNKPAKHSTRVIR